jgi:hypothetical protein
VVVIEGGAFVGEDVVVVTGSDWLRWSVGSVSDETIEVSQCTDPKGKERFEMLYMTYTNTVSITHLQCNYTQLVSFN